LTTSKKKYKKPNPKPIFFFSRGAAPPSFPKSRKPERAGAAASLPSPVYIGRPPFPFDFLLPLNRPAHIPLPCLSSAQAAAPSFGTQKPSTNQIFSQPPRAPPHPRRRPPLLCQKRNLSHHHWTFHLYKPASTDSPFPG
jgi:hypothetical protein